MRIKVSKIPTTHEDDRRKLTAIFNGDFIAKQIKILEIKKEQKMGNHYHLYPELFYVLKGYAEFFLKDIDTQEEQLVVMTDGDCLVIREKIVHKMLATPTTILIEATTEPYVSPEINDRKFIIDD